MACLPQPLEDKGTTREKLAEATGVKHDKLETIMDIARLAETGKTAIKTVSKSQNQKLQGGLGAFIDMEQVNFWE